MAHRLPPWRAFCGGVALALISLAGPPARAASLWTQPTLLGSLGGARPFLAKNGITLGAVEQAVPSVVLAGGAAQGPAYAGLLTLSARLDLARAAGLAGLSAYVSAYLVQGHGPTAFQVHSLSGIAFVEAPGGARLGDAYLSWRAPGDRVHLKLGKFGIDENFDQNPAAATLLDSNFTYRDIMANNLPGGGPAYSYSGPGAMAAIGVTPWLRLRGGVFSGDPLGQPLLGPPPPARDGDGLAFPLDTGALVIGEAQMRYRLPGLGPGTLRLGGIYDTLSRPDRAVSASGQSLALAATGAAVGPARSDRGDWVLYGGATQVLWNGLRHRRLTGFLRLAGAPADRNLISFDAQAGAVLRAPFRSRRHDSVAFAVSYDRISPRLAGVIRAENSLTGSAQPVPTAEMVFELAYAAVLTPWLTLTPDLQYIAGPGGGIADPADPARREPNAVIAQVQATVTFW